VAAMGIDLAARMPGARLWPDARQERPGILVYWCDRLRAATRGVPTAILTFPRSLQAIWRLDSAAHVPAAAAARLRR
jgi:hypothetical protein